MDQIARIFSKYMLVPGLVINGAVALALLLTSDDQRTTSGKLYTFATSNRTATQILLQIVAQGLGLLVTFAISTLFNYWSRSRLPAKPTTMETMKLWQSICAASPDWTLRLPGLLLSLSFSGFIFVPPAIWAGALTPFVVSEPVNGSIAIAVYDPDPDNVFWNRLQNAHEQ